MLLALYINGQDKGFHIGGRFGLGESHLTGNGLQSVQRKLAISTGVTTNYQFNKFLGLNADFLLSTAGAKATGVKTETGVFGNPIPYAYRERFDLICAEVPLTGQTSVWIDNFFIRGFAGPAINFKLIGLTSRQYDDAGYNNNNGYADREMENLNNIFYSVIYGAGIGVQANDNRLFFLDIRFNKGVTTLGKVNGFDAISNYYSISAGYVF